MVAALASGADDAAVAVRAALESFVGRVRQYGSALYALATQVYGEGSRGEPVRWNLDDSIPDSSHCSDCLQYGDREYRSYDDMLAETGGLFPGSPALADSGNCRCWITAEMPA